MANLMQQVSGKADVTVNKNGILISKDGKDGADLIDEAMRHNGTLPPSATPEAPTNRSPRATPPPAEQKTNGTAPAPDKP